MKDKESEWYWTIKHSLWKVEDKGVIALKCYL